MTPYYDFMDAFLLGLKLESFYANSAECIQSVTYFIDDWAYLENNNTLRTSDLDPFINFTALVAGNFTESTLNCYLFGYSVYTVSTTQFQSFGNVGNYALSFLFN